MAGDRSLLRRAAAALCVVLALAYAAAMTGGMVDRVAHELHAPHAHHHLSFADVAFADDFHEAHTGLSGSPDASGDHLSHGHHHHVGDGPSSHPVSVMHDYALRAQARVTFRPADETRRSVARFSIDQPPKFLAAAA